MEMSSYFIPYIYMNSHLMEEEDKIYMFSNPQYTVKGNQSL